jgi:hypothetical protein
MAQILSPGTAAPSFTLRVTPDQSLSSEELSSTFRIFGDGAPLLDSPEDVL